MARGSAGCVCKPLDLDGTIFVPATIVSILTMQFRFLVTGVEVKEISRDAARLFRNTA
jgi:hypothetical protein